MDEKQSESRPLATIQRIVALESIPGADLIETATVLGWKVVVKKGEFKVGDLAVYFEIDSIIPIKDWCAFLAKGKEGVETVRLKTVRLKGQISQGLLIPPSVVGLLPQDEGNDVTAALGVTKYNPPCDGGDLRARSTRPHWIPKTDEIRIQNIPWIVDYIKDKQVYVTQKLDGSSMSLGNHPVTGKHISSRNMDLKLEYDNRFTTTGRPLLDRLPVGYVVQGELCGPGIQSNRLGLTALDFFVFNVIHIETGEYLGLREMEKFCADNGFKMVPVLSYHLAPFKTLAEWLSFAESSVYPNGHPQEGIVIRCIKPEKVAFGRDKTDLALLSFKVISNKFLLKIGE